MELCRLTFNFVTLITVLVAILGRQRGEWPRPKALERILALLQICHSQLCRSCISSMAINYLYNFPIHKNKDISVPPTQVQVMSGSHSMVQHTRTTASWPWRALVILLCSVKLTSLLVANILLLGTGSSPIKLEFPATLHRGISTETELRWWYSCIVEEVERMGSTAVRYLIQWMLPRTYTLECT